VDLIEGVTAEDHQLGPAGARLVVVEYGDFECANCKQAAPAVDMLLQRFEGQVRFVYRHCPLEEVHRHAVQAAEAAECAGAQGHFWAMYQLLFENQYALELDQLHGYAQRLWLDMYRYTRGMTEHTHLARVRSDIDSGRKSGVRATPGFFFNGKRQDVSFGLRLLFDATEAALQRG
jgi:protein-disulfide isomerase